MPARRWILLDAQQDVSLPELQLSAAELAEAADTSADALAEAGVVVRRLCGGRRDGVQVVQLNNGCCHLVVLASRGLGIWRGQCGPVQLGWQSPVTDGPVHPQWVPVWEPSGIGWLEGFDEWLVRCGMASMGAPGFDAQGRLQWPLHGRVANLPAHYLELQVDSAGLTLRGSVREGRLFGGHLELQSTLHLPWNAAEFQIADRVQNRSAQAASMEMLYHLNFGLPWLAPGAQVHVAYQEMAPRDARAAEGLGQWNTIGPPEPGFAEQVYFFRPLADAEGWAQAVLAHPQGDSAVSVRFQTSGLPWFVLWKNQQPSQDGYVVGLEPATAFPNVRDFEQQQGRLVELAPEQSHAMNLHVQIHATAKQVQQAVEHVQTLQRQTPGTVHPQPLAGWSPG